MVKGLRLSIDGELAKFEQSSSAAPDGDIPAFIACTFPVISDGWKRYEIPPIREVVIHKALLNTYSFIKFLSFFNMLDLDYIFQPISSGQAT